MVFMKKEWGLLQLHSKNNKTNMNNKDMG